MAVIDLDNKYCNSSLVNGESCILRTKILIFIHYPLQYHVHLSPYIHTYYVQLHTSSYRHVGLCVETEARASTAALGSGDPSFTSGSVNWLFYRNPLFSQKCPLQGSNFVSLYFTCTPMVYGQSSHVSSSPISSCWDHLSLSRLVTLISIY